MTFILVTSTTQLVLHVASSAHVAPGARQLKPHTRVISRTCPLSMIVQSDVLRQALPPSGNFVDLLASQLYLGSAALKSHGSLSSAWMVTHTISPVPPSPLVGGGGSELELHPTARKPIEANRESLVMERRSSIPPCCPRTASPSRPS